MGLLSIGGAVFSAGKAVAKKARKAKRKIDKVNDFKTECIQLWREGRALSAACQDALDATGPGGKDITKDEAIRIFKRTLAFTRKFTDAAESLFNELDGKK